jgi:hypothetical protein
MSLRYLSAVLGGSLVIGWSTVAAAQSANPPPAPVEAPDAPPDSAFLLQARMQTTQSILSVAGIAPGVLLGYQLRGFALGVGFGLTRASVTTSSDGDSTSGTLFQVSPTIIVDIWRSRNQLTRANLVGSVGYGQASITSTYESEVCSTNSAGVQTCTTRETESKSSATLIPVQIGLGGDHFLGRNFGIGAEAGQQMLFASGLEANGRSVDGSASTQAVYGLLRMTLLIGD